MDPIAIKIAVYEEIARYINATQFNAGTIGEKYYLEAHTTTDPNGKLNGVKMGLNKNSLKGTFGRVIPVVMPKLNRHMRQIEIGNILYTDNNLLSSNHSDFIITATASVIAHYLGELDEYGDLIKKVLIVAHD